MSEKPDLKLAGFSLWARSRQYPDADDYWDGNWLNIRALVEAPGSSVEATGPWLRNDELADFVTQLEALDRDLTGDAELHCAEPALGLKVACSSLGHVRITVELTPDHMTQTHQVIFDVDQTYLKPAVAACRRILDRFPIRGAPT